MDCRDRRLLFVLVATTLAAASAVLLGMHSDVLLALPVVLFALPLLAGRYVGEERLARLAAAFVSPHRRSYHAPSTARRSPHALPRGGTLIAASLAVRPPPVAPHRAA